MNKILKKCKEMKTVCIFCVIIMTIVISSLLYIVFQKQSVSGMCYANIYQKGELIRTINLNMVQESYTITIESDDGGINKIEVRDNEIGFIYADCPDGLCVDMGFVGNSKLPLVCLPHQLVIEVVEVQEDVMDGIAY